MKVLITSFLSSSQCVTTLSISHTGDLQAVPTAPPAKSPADDFALLNPTATPSILPLTQPTSVGEQAASLRDVFVPLSAIKPSE